MHVLHIPAWYSTPENPQLGNFFREQIFALQNSGIKCGVFYPQYSFSFSERFKKNKAQKSLYNDKGVLTLRENINPILPFDKFTALNMSHFKKKVIANFEEYMKENNRPDLIHAHGIYMGAIAAYFIHQKYQIPYINTEQFTGLIIGNQEQNPVLKNLLLETFEQASTVVLCTHAFKNSLITKYGFDQNIFTIIPNMVNPLFCDPIPPPDIDSFVFLNIAYLHPKKNHELLLNVFAEVLKKYPKSRLEIVGNGDLLGHLTDLASKLGITEAIHFHGLVDRMGVKKLLDKCHATILTSKIETFGVCIIESLGAGRPAIATKSGGPEEIINAQNGIVVEDHEVRAVAQAMEELIKNYNQYNYVQISKDCVDRYSGHKIAKDITELYHKVLQNG